MAVVDDDSLRRDFDGDNDYGSEIIITRRLCSAAVKNQDRSFVRNQGRF